MNIKWIKHGLSLNQKWIKPGLKCIKKGLHTD